jgi:hypothetical protein
MSSDSSRPPAVAPTAAEREAVMSALGDAYAADRLELDELELRMAAVYRATSHDALQEVLRGLVRPQAPAVSAAPPPLAPELPNPSASARAYIEASYTQRAYEMGMAVVARPEIVPARAVVAAVFGGAERKGGWVVPRQLKIVAVMGGVDLDLREAQFGDGVTEIEVFTMFGGVDIKVPTGLRVETTGVGIMGGFSVASADADPGPDAPVLRITGLAIMGGVDAKLKRLRKVPR